MTKEFLGNWFREACDAAGVPGSAHGLPRPAPPVRRTTARRVRGLRGFSVGAAAESRPSTRAQPIESALRAKRLGSSIGSNPEQFIPNFS